MKHQNIERRIRRLARLAAAAAIAGVAIAATASTTTTHSSTAAETTGDAVGVAGVITAGAEHTCALGTSGVQCWGNNQFGQLGNNLVTESHLPMTVGGLPTGVRAVASGGFHGCALVNGGVQCWGYNSNGQLGNASTATTATPVGPVNNLTTGVQAIAAGDLHTCALVNGGVKCWGFNFNGQLGNGASGAAAEQHIPVPVTNLATGGQAIVAGASHN